MLCNYDAIEEGIAFEGAKLILQDKREYHVFLASRVLCDYKTNEGGLALEGAKLILQAETEYHAQYASRVLCDSDAIETGIALEAAKYIILHPECDGKLLAETFINEAKKIKQRYDESNNQTQKEIDLPIWDYLIKEVENGDNEINPMSLVRKIPKKM